MLALTAAFGSKLNCFCPLSNISLGVFISLFEKESLCGTGNLYKISVQEIARDEPGECFLIAMQANLRDRDFKDELSLQCLPDIAGSSMMVIIEKCWSLYSCDIRLRAISRCMPFSPEPLVNDQHE